MSFLVDTNVFSELVKRSPDRRVIAWLRENEANLYVSVITMGEIRSGIERLPSGQRKTHLEEWLRFIGDAMQGRILSFNLSTAHLWGQLVAQWAQKGVTIPTTDGQLAATAKRYQLTLATRNVVDFKAAGISLINPFQN